MGKTLLVKNLISEINGENKLKMSKNLLVRTKSSFSQNNPWDEYQPTMRYKLISRYVFFISIEINKIVTKIDNTIVKIELFDTNISIANSIMIKGIQFK